AVLDLGAARGPVPARQIDLGPPTAAGGWWQWSDAKTALEWLFRRGQVAVVARNRQFERLYDLPERVIPAAVFNAPPPDREQAHRVLIGRAAAALGVATAPHLADYFRTGLPETRAAIQALAADGLLEAVSVADWKGPAWLWSAAPSPRTLQANCLISPFDNLVFERRRLAQLFEVDYRLSLYTPAQQRTHGYYVYLFLRGERLAARVDLKADRQRSCLLVQSAWLEEATHASREAAAVAEALAAELRRAAAWQGLAEIAVADRGTLAARLRAALTKTD
ncbi:MAG: winged helix DNA-binding domain-containing protein, partial [Bifidobacteriaceae bacterium]|nr:winged helix DNA-binding domain-containing protein [Bifidobacteriaceae bacterium]